VAVVSADVLVEMLRREPDAVTLWRCTECQKWSHAMKRPARHKRFILDPENIPEGKMAEYLPEVGIQGGHDGAYVWCGPFARWTAVQG
jgi:hypothetical protein